ncbi:MAG: histidine kinase [Porticoccaceae bacterium]|jgi:hypothetical protein
MKTFNKTLIAAATITTFGLAAAPAAVSLEASASIATSYLWRGHELGDGDAALAVDVSGSTGALSYGLWVSSGDNEVAGEGGTEYDIYASYSGSAGDLGYSIGYASYNYPTTGVGFDDSSEYIYGLSYGPASVTIFDNTETDYEYTVIGYEAGAFSFAYGDDETDTHFDVSYAVNDSLSLTVSDSDRDGADPIVVASYTLPF